MAEGEKGGSPEPSQAAVNPEVSRGESGAEFPLLGPELGEEEKNQTISLAAAYDVLESEMRELLMWPGTTPTERKERREQEEGTPKARLRRKVQMVINLAVSFGRGDPGVQAAMDRAEREGRAPEPRPWTDEDTRVAYEEELPEIRRRSEKRRG